MLLRAIFEVVRSHLEALYDPIKKLRVLSQLRAAFNITTQLFVLLPDIVQHPRGLVKFLSNLEITFEVKLRNMWVCSFHFIFLVIIGSVLLTDQILSSRILNLKNFWFLLLATTVVLACRPIIVELRPDFPIFFFLVTFKYKGVLKQFWPCQPFIWSLVQESLQERLEIWGHIIRELDWVFNNQVDQRIN